MIWNLLKRVLWLSRTGWLQSGVPPSIAENVAQHSFLVAILSYKLAYLLSEKGLRVNPERAAVLGLIHDLPEGFTGDLPKFSSSLIDKDRLEKATLIHMDNDFIPLINEFIEQNSLEAKVAKIADHLATAYIAREYIRKGFDVKEILESSLKTASKLIKGLGPNVDDLLSGFIEGLP